MYGRLAQLWVMAVCFRKQEALAMPASLCLHCAAFKDGPWAPCPACAYQPTDQDDLAKAMILSEVKYTHDELALLQGQHRRGESWSFDPTLVAHCKTQLMSAGGVTTVGSQGDGLFKEPLGGEDPGDILIDRFLIPIALLGIPLLPLESMGRGLLKILTLGTATCTKDMAWRIGLLAYLLWIGVMVLLFLAH